MVIAHIVAPAKVGGAERVIEALAAGHHARNHDVLVIGVVEEDDQPHPFLDRLERSGVRTIAVHVPPRGYLKERSRIAQICRDLQPDVVHTHGYRADVLAGWVARGLGIPTVTTVHGFTGGAWKNRAYQWIQRRSFRHFDAVVAVSRPLYRALLDAGLSADRLYMLPNAWSPGASTLDPAAARRALSVNHAGFHVGWVGRLSPEKGPDVMIRAVAHLADLPIEVSMLGGGHEEGRLRALAANLGLAQRVRWHGIVPQAERVFAGFDAFALSSRTEGTPIALFEAMAACVPIAASRVGGVPDVLDEECAYLVPADDPRALALRLRRIFDDPTEAETRARRAHALLRERFAVEPWLDAHEHVYGTVIRTGRRARVLVRVGAS